MFYMGGNHAINMELKHIHLKIAREYQNAQHFSMHHLKYIHIPYACP